jgi:hypothetical protein
VLVLVILRAKIRKKNDINYKNMTLFSEGLETFFYIDATKIYGSMGNFVYFCRINNIICTDYYYSSPFLWFLSLVSDRLDTSSPLNVFPAGSSMMSVRISMVLSG